MQVISLLPPYKKGQSGARSSCLRRVRGRVRSSFHHMNKRRHAGVLSCAMLHMVDIALCCTFHILFNCTYILSGVWKRFFYVLLITPHHWSAVCTFTFVIYMVLLAYFKFFALPNLAHILRNRSSDDGTCRIWDARYSQQPPRIYIHQNLQMLPLVSSLKHVYCVCMWNAYILFIPTARC